LKYRNFETDFSELQRELHGEDGPSPDDADGASDEADEDEDPYADRYDEPESAQQR
jgi:hypothetical protein